MYSLTDRGSIKAIGKSDSKVKLLDNNRPFFGTVGRDRRLLVAVEGLTREQGHSAVSAWFRLPAAAGIVN